MVCKEDVLLWFKDLEGYQRIDVLYELLKMCLPFEVRFLGSCVEEIGKQTYQELYGQTVSANDVERIARDPTFSNAAGVYSENVRHKVLIYLSLLSSKNYSVADWLYRKVLRTERVDDILLKKDPKVLNEFLLLYIMALYHPAFTFEQKLHFDELISQIIDCKENRRRHAQICGYPPGFSYPAVKTFNPLEIPMVPVKPPIGVPCEEVLQHPPGFPHAVPPPLHHQHPEFIAWTTTGLPCGAPEIPPPFPAPAISPLVNESSPNQSRSTSPHQAIITIRTTHQNIPFDTIATGNYPAFYGHDIKLPDDEFHHMEKGIPHENQWAPKPPNGLRFVPIPPPPPAKIPQQRPFILETPFQNLTIDQENNSCSRHSNSSSNSSLSHTPPETPRNDNVKNSMINSSNINRINGSTAPPPPPPPPPTFGTQMKGTAGHGGVPVCEMTTSPPPQIAGNLYNSVPYPTNFPPTIRTAVFPAYTQTYRPPFPPVHYQQPTTNDNNLSAQAAAYTIPSAYMSFMYSNPQFAAQQSRNPPNCYNCGGLGHTGMDCSTPNIEDMTQQATSYSIEFSSPPPDPGPPASTQDK